MKNSKLYKHQEEFLKRNPNKRLLCWDTGTGKTRAAIEWARDKGYTLFICPKALKENWHREIIKWGAYPYVLLSKEEFKKAYKNNSLVDEMGAVVIDEAHYFASIQSQLTKALYSYTKKKEIKYILLLTATPFMSTPFNIYVLARHLGNEWHYMDFKLKYFSMVRMGARLIPIPRRDMQDDLKEAVQKIGDIVKLEDCVDVPEQVFEKEVFALTKKQEKLIKDDEETNPIVRFTRQHQIENGSLRGDGYVDDLVIPYDKVDRIKEIVGSHKKVAIVCRYNIQLYNLREELKDHKPKVYLINGSVKNRDWVIQQAEDADECVILIQAMCSEGYELPSIGVCVFVSMDWGYKNYKQMLGRFLRINKLKKNVYLHLVSKGGVDEAVYRSIVKKQDFDATIYGRDV